MDGSRLMALAVLPPDIWHAIKMASITGVSDSDLAAKFHVAEGTIRKRRFDDPLWKAALARDHVTKRNNALSAAHLTTTLAERGQKANNHLAKVAANLAKRTRSSALKVPRDVAELKTLIGAVRLAHGMDRETKAVSVNIWNGGQSVDLSAEGEAIDLE